MNRIALVTAMFILTLGAADAQLKSKLKNINVNVGKEGKDGEAGPKKKKMSIGERMGNLTANLMTSQTDALNEVVAKITYVSGVYPPEIGTSEANYWPEATQEGDYMVGVTFMKNDGIGVYDVNGEITINGEPVQSVGPGSYGKRFYLPPVGPVELGIKTASGDEASFSVDPVPDIHLLSVNGEQSLPIVNLDEDLTIEFTNPPGSEGTKVRVSMITDAMGARFLNHFADLDAGTEATRTVTIPKAAFANTEITASHTDIANFNKGENYLIIERERLLNKDQYDERQNPGNVAASDISLRTYSVLPVIVKGKQDDGMLYALKITGEAEGAGYSLHKPNAQTGIPFSEASKFGLVSFTMSAKTFHTETEENSSSWTVGNTRYTRTTITTTTLEFPQLPDSHWDHVLNRIYKDIVAFFESEYNINFVPVEDVVGAPQYSTLFPATDENTQKEVKRSYKGTQRSTPQNMRELFANRSSNFTADNPQVNMMKAAGDVDGLVSINLSLTIGANKDNNVVLIPKLTTSIEGRDETNNDKQGTYMSGLVTRNTGVPFSSDAVMSDPEELLKVCSHEQLLQALKAGINSMRTKEVEAGYDDIWNIGE
ncbi:MAG: hypothetical protein JXQ90_00875 [Cyclobacteriaceae bacterium]